MSVSVAAMVEDPSQALAVPLADVASISLVFPAVVDVPAVGESDAPPPEAGWRHIRSRHFLPHAPFSEGPRVRDSWEFSTGRPRPLPQPLASVLVAVEDGCTDDADGHQLALDLLSVTVIPDHGREVFASVRVAPSPTAPWTIRQLLRLVAAVRWFATDDEEPAAAIVDGDGRVLLDWAVAEVLRRSSSPSRLQATKPAARPFVFAVPNRRLSDPVVRRLSDWLASSAPATAFADGPGYASSLAVPYWEGTAWYAALGGGGLVLAAPGGSQFFREILPDQFRHEYLLAYSKALRERDQLVAGLASLAQIDVSGRSSLGPLEEVRRVQHDFLRLRMTGFGSQISERRQSLQQYSRRCFVALGLEELSDELAAQLGMAEALLSNLALEEGRRFERRLEWIVLLGGTLGLAFGFLGINIRRITSEEGVDLLLLVVLVLLVVVSFTLGSLVVRRSTGSGARKRSR